MCVQISTHQRNKTTKALLLAAKEWMMQPECCFKKTSLAQLNNERLGNGLEQGSPTPGPRTGTGLWPVRNRAAQQEVSGGRASEASSAAPHRSPSLTSPPEPFPPSSVEKLVFHETGPWCQKGWGPLV